MWSIVVHSGAGAVKDSLATKHKAGCTRAIASGAEVLRAGGSAVDAVCAAARVLEDDPTYNASIGAALDERGLATVDAAVMRGSDLAYGAIGCVAGIIRAVDLARAVMEDGRHSFLVGPAVLAFARRKGIEVVDPRRLCTEARLRDLQQRAVELSRPGADVAADWTPSDQVGAPGADAPGTIGAVARDGSGLIAAATSTGGLTAKYAGRVGDSPIAGAGTYARDDLGGASATGHGETMMRTVYTYQLLLSLRGVSGDRAPAVIRAELDRAAALAGGKGGAIVVLPDGTIAFGRNTAHMGVAWAYADGRDGADF